MEVAEDENAERRGQRAAPASVHIAANILCRAKFAAADLGQHVPDLRFEPDTRPAPPDPDIAHRKDRSHGEPKVGGQHYSGRKVAFAAEVGIRNQSWDKRPGF